MSQRGKGEKVASLAEKKDAADTACVTLIGEAEEYESTCSKMEAMSGQERSEYVSKNKGTWNRKMKTRIKKILGKDKPNKKVSTLYMYPIVAATLKFHVDDDVDPAPEKSTLGD